MSDLGIEFSVATLPKSTNSYDPIPAGWYQARIIDAEAKATKDGGGQYLKMRWEVLGPTHASRQIFGNVTLRNHSEVAEKIGQEQLSAMMTAVGLATLSRTEQLIGKSCEVKVTIRPERDQYEASNEIRGFRGAKGAMPVVAPLGSAPVATAKKPWEK